jgi:hypothetical protein
MTDASQSPPASTAIAPEPPAEVPAVRPAAAALDWTTAGRSPFTAEQDGKLRAPTNPQELQIKPTGEIYLPQIHFRRRLCEAFGAGGWALVPLSTADLIDGVMCMHYALVINGQVIGEAVGEMAYRDNDRMSEATAREGAKSDALTRICKDLGIAWECWDPQFSATWRREYALRVYRRKEGKWRWRRRDAEPFEDEEEADPDRLRLQRAVFAAAREVDPPFLPDEVRELARLIYGAGISELDATSLASFGQTLRDASRNEEVQKKLAALLRRGPEQRDLSLRRSRTYDQTMPRT